MIISFKWLFSLILFMCCLGCARNARIEYAVESPDNAKSVVLIVYDYMLKPNLRIELQRKEKPAVLLYENSKSEVYVSFAEVAWSKDSKVVGILVRNPHGESLLFGYDVSKEVRVNQEVVMDILREAIRNNYKLSDRDAVDPLKWLSSEESRDAYYRRVEMKGK